MFRKIFQSQTDARVGKIARLAKVGEHVSETVNFPSHFSFYMEFKQLCGGVKYIFPQKEKYWLPWQHKKHRRE